MKKLIIQIILYLIGSIFITILIKLFFFQVYTFNGDSMLKSVASHRKLIISKFSKVRVGDIILIKDNLSEKFYLSRLAAKEGDTVSIFGQDLYVNREPIEIENQLNRYYLNFLTKKELIFLSQNYNVKFYNASGIYTSDFTISEYKSLINDSLWNLSKKILPVQNKYNIFFCRELDIIDKFISKDSVFILNDNRNNMNDSRSIGLIHKKQIIGKLIYWF